MISKDIKTTPICDCGSKDFATLDRSRNRVGRLEFRLVCRRCGQSRKVSKSTYALYNYLCTRKASEEFLKIYDLG